MSNLEAKLASAFIVTAAIGLGGLAAGLPDYVATAADGCLTEPNGATSQGQHWYYHLERGTGRKCWYLRGEGEQSARADAPAAVPSRKPAPRRQEAATTHSIADARAELGPRTRVADDATPSVWPNPPAAMAAPALLPLLPTTMRQPRHSHRAGRNPPARLQRTRTRLRRTRRPKPR